jgi:peptidoglycan hydrolase CwlO-like protein
MSGLQLTSLSREQETYHLAKQTALYGMWDNIEGSSAAPHIMVIIDQITPYVESLEQQVIVAQEYCTKQDKENQLLSIREQEQAKQIAELQAEVQKLQDVKNSPEWHYAYRCTDLEAANIKLTEEVSDLRGRNDVLNECNEANVIALNLGRCADLEVQVNELTNENQELKILVKALEAKCAKVDQLRNLLDL